MAKRDFIKRPKNRDFMVLPSIIFEDERLSISAKGLYAQLYYSSNSITSLDDLVGICNSTKEELDKYFDELTSIGYIVVKKGEAEFVIKPQGEKTVAKKLDQNEINEFKTAVKEKPKVLNAYEKMIGLISTYNFDSKVENLLISYFEKWLNKRGRFVDADPLHGYVVRAKINDLVSFHLSDEDMISCIQASIDHEWFKFVDPKSNSTNYTTSTTPINQFDKSAITSNSYTKEDIEKIKEKAEMLEAEGKKGTF